MKQWQLLISYFKQIKQITDDSYPQFQHLIEYLDNEDLLKADLLVKSPAHNISYDVKAFQE
jgi:hypothetical protein